MNKNTVYIDARKLEQLISLESQKLEKLKEKQRIEKCVDAVAGATRRVIRLYSSNKLATVLEAFFFEINEPKERMSASSILAIANLKKEIKKKKALIRALKTTLAIKIICRDLRQIFRCIVLAGFKCLNDFSGSEEEKINGTHRNAIYFSFTNFTLNEKQTGYNRNYQSNRFSPGWLRA